MKVVITQAADSDLERIGDYIAIDSPRRAVTFTEELLQSALRLGEYPQAYPVIPRFDSRGMRRKPFGSYLIFYIAEQDRVVVERILHSAQDYEAILFPGV